MKNAEVFNSYDMVVTVTEETINAELKHLVEMEIIKPEFVLIQEVVGRKYVYRVLASASEIPRDAEGKPTVACIDTQIVPQVVIAESGEDITFELSFPSGTAYFWEGTGPTAELVKYEIKDWSYGVEILLNLEEVKKEDINKKIAVPKPVEEQLHEFIDSMFSVESLLMDFESTELMRFDPAHSNAGAAGDAGLSQLVSFMNFYLKDLQEQGNPYILGYPVKTGPETKYPTGSAVPSELAPVGTTYTMYQDPETQGRSNLNFVLATKGGHGTVTGSPGTFDENWIHPGEQCDAKMIYSHSCLVEPFILEPFFEELEKNIWASVGAQLDDLDAGAGYASAKASGTNGYSFTISNVTSGDQQYVNTFEAELITTPGPAAEDGLPSALATIQLKGQLSFFKEVSKNMVACTATAYATQSEDWSATIQVEATKDAQGLPTLAITPSAVTTSNSSKNSDKNKCAEAWDIVGKILDGLLDVFTAGLASLVGDGGPLESALGTEIPGIGNVGQLFGNLGSSIGNNLLLPAGGQFSFKNPALDVFGNLSTELTYKSAD